MEDVNRPPPDEAWKPADDNYPQQALDDDSDIPRAKDGENWN